MCQEFIFKFKREPTTNAVLISNKFVTCRMRLYCAIYLPLYILRLMYTKQSKLFFKTGGIKHARQREVKSSSFPQRIHNIVCFFFEKRSHGSAVSAARLCRLVLYSNSCSAVLLPDATKYLTTILRLSYDNAKVTIDLRQTSHSQNILRRTQGLSQVQFTCKIVRSSEIVFVHQLTIFQGRSQGESWESWDPQSNPTKNY